MNKLSIVTKWILLICFIFIILILAFIFKGNITGNLFLPKSEDNITIGIIAPLTGPLSVFGNSITSGVLMAKEDINDPHLNIIFEDDAGNYNQALNAATKLIELDNVDVVLNFGSASSQAITPYLNDKNIYQFAITMDSSIVSKNKNAIIIYPTNYYEAKAISNYFKDKNANIGILYSNVQTHTDEIVFIRENLLSINNITYIDKIEMTDNDFKTIVAKLKNQNIDYLIVLLYPAHLKLFLEEKIKQDYKIDLVGNMNFNSVDYNLIPNNSVFVTMPIYFEDNSILENLLNKNYNITNEKVDKYIFAYSYDNINVIYKSQKNKLTKEDLINKQFEGISGIIKITDRGYIDPDLVMGKIRNGKLNPI